MPIDLDVANGSGRAIEEVIKRAPDDSLETRTIKRAGWSLQLGLTIVIGISAVVGGGVLMVQAGESDDCQDQIEQLRSDWQGSQSLLLAQINDRLDHQSGELVRCQSESALLRDEIRDLESEFRAKLDELRD